MRVDPALTTITAPDASLAAARASAVSLLAELAPARELRACAAAASSRDLVSLLDEAAAAADRGAAN